MIQYDNIVEKENIPPQVIVENIREERKNLQIEGAYLRSSQLAVERQGNGYFILEDSSGNPLLVLVDISLARHLRYASDRKLIIESRIFRDLALAFQGNESEPIYILQKLRQFYPSYLTISGDSFDWGFSVSTAFLNPREKSMEISSMGTNLAGTQSPKKTGKFKTVFPIQPRFFSPAINNRDGGPVAITTTTIPWGTILLIATDGIIKYRKLIMGAARIDLTQPPENLLSTKKEGLYLVIKTK